MNAFDKPPGLGDPDSRTALLVGADQSMLDALQSVLRPAGFACLLAFTGTEAVQAARGAEPDLVLITDHVPDAADVVDVIRNLRRDHVTPPRTPVIVVSAGPVLRARRLAALRAGAWDIVGFPLDTEELLLRVDVYLAAKEEVDASGDVYGVAGMRRRARELVAAATRRREGVACVALGWQVPAGSPATASDVAHVLQTRGRLSDAIGRLNREAYVILAPGTDAVGATRLAERFTTLAEAASPSLAIYVGYEVVTDVAAHPVQSEDLLKRAHVALRAARSPGSARIRRYDPSMRQQ